ncbi:hypothetical protein MKZ38_002996 [Zalerion maritima]|uniref:Uncharacterized protein n=1 Tax=Zalerion maritima TaxID=339359 RepID=A0AAD5RPK8_9PEZI|nr:hypothetical protein MKZ38_002996 [Zalerion maritima]
MPSTTYLQPLSPIRLLTLLSSLASVSALPKGRGGGSSGGSSSGGDDDDDSDFSLFGLSSTWSYGIVAAIVIVVIVIIWYSVKCCLLPRLRKAKDAAGGKLSAMKIGGASAGGGGAQNGGGTGSYAPVPQLLQDHHQAGAGTGYNNHSNENTAGQAGPGGLQYPSQAQYAPYASQTQPPQMTGVGYAGAEQGIMGAQYPSAPPPQYQQQQHPQQGQYFVPGGAAQGYYDPGMGHRGVRRPSARCKV